MRILKTVILLFFGCLMLAAAGVYMVFAHYKEELAEAVTDHLNSRFNTDIKAGRIRVSLVAGWPRGALQLRDVSATSARFPGSHLKAESITISFNLRELLQKRFSVQSLTVRNGDILFIRAHDSTQTNVADSPQQDTTGSEFTFDIRRIHLRNTRLVYQSPGPGQHFDMIFKDDVIRVRQFTDGLRARIKGTVFSKGLVFRANRGEFFDSSDVRLDLRLNFLYSSKSLCVEPRSRVSVDRHEYNVAGLLNFGEVKTIGLMVETHGVRLDEVRRFVNPRIRKTLNNYEASRPFDASVKLFASMGKREEPALVIDASTRHNSIRIGSSGIPYEDVRFSARIACVDHTGKKGDIENATVTFTRLYGRVYDFPFTARVTVRNLRRPYLAVDAKMNIDASKIGFGLKDEFDLSGTAHARIRYSGLADRINKKEFLSNRMKLTADLQLINLQYREKKRPYVYVLNGPASVVNNDVHFSGLRLSSVVGEAVLEGKVDKFVNYLFGYSNGFRASLTAQSDSLNLNPVLMRHRHNDTLISGNAGETAVSDSSAIAYASDSLRSQAIQKQKEQLSRFEFDVRLNAKKMVIRRVHAEDARVRLQYNDETLDVKSLCLYTCGGKFTASGVIEKFSTLKADVSVEDVDVNALFTQFENFGQETIVSDNLKGKMHVQARFYSQLDDQLEVIGETMSGEVRLSLKDGQLVNFGPVQKLSNFLFRNRDFNHVSFSELNESFQVRGYEMTINELEIGSNILNLYVVNGVYNFKGQSNINLLVPWSNLKRRNKDHIPATSGERAGNTKGVKLNFSGPSNNMKLSLGHKDLIALKPSI